jgi:hypothetical protein
VTSHFVSLSHRIYTELADIEPALTRAQLAWREYLESGNEFFLDSVALNLHGFYSGLEKLFERIARGLDNRLPGGRNWHQALLNQMATEVANVRPKVISKTTLAQLDEYRRFRHVVRSVYSYDLDPDRLCKLIDSSSDTYKQIEEELIAFARWLASVE